MKAQYLMMAAGLLSAGSALAQQPVSAEVTRQAREPVATELPAERPLDDYRCLRYTGSMITAMRNQRDELRPPKTQTKPRCAPATGRSWSRQDLERTGALNVVDALRMLDPSVH